MDANSVKGAIESINALIQKIEVEIQKISDADKNVYEHLKQKSLESKKQRLSRLRKILCIEKYNVAFIGTIGAGKTTAICHLFGLTGEFEKQAEINGKKRKIQKTEPLLSTGAGRTTISEVIIKSGDNTSIKIEPYPKEKLEGLIRDFCSSFYSEEADNDAISIELDRAIRTITKLKKVVEKTGDNTKTKTVDQAKEKSRTVREEELIEIALENANLDNRFYSIEESELVCPTGVDAQDWLRSNFDKINKAEIESFSIPKRIYVFIGSKDFDSEKVSMFESVIDTKGIDENPIRLDLKQYIEQDDTICLFTSRYNDAPETNIRTLMQYFLTQKSKDYKDRFVTFVLPKKGEPEQENDGDGNRSTGLGIKRDIIDSVFSNNKIPFNRSNILFYDALQFFDSRGRIDRDYEQEDIDGERLNVMTDLTAVIERRQNALIDEANRIEESFLEIQTGHSLTQAEIEAIESAVNEITVLSNLNNRLQSFVYENFVDEYIEYYATNYPYWNTKDAIHRRLGTFEERGYDTYFDAKVVVEGVDKDEMLRKFTAGPKSEVEQAISQLGEANEDLKTFTPEILKRFEIAYDKFIDNVGDSLYDILRNSNENHTFWRELIDRRGRGSGYNNDVCTLLRRKLDTVETSNGIYPANRLVQEYAERYWKEVVSEVLGFFQ